MQSRFIALVVLAILVPAAWGQAAKTGDADTEAEAAMERAKRAAAGPLRAIQQAAKIRRRGEPEPAPAAALVAASAAVAPTVAPERTAEPAEPAVEVLLELGSLVPAVATVAPIGPETLAAAQPTALPPTMGATQPLLDPLPVPPQVLEMVEPNIPPALLAQGPRSVEVEAELSLRADGSVADVTLLPPVPRAWQRYIVAALERWRYEPMSSPRTHRVRLVFSGSAER